MNPLASGALRTTTQLDPDITMMATAWSLLRQTVSEWSEDGAPRLGAALAYYSVFSIGPLLLIAIGIAGVFFNSAQAEGQVLDQVGRLVGAKGAEAVKALVANASIGNQSLFGTLIGVALLLFGAIAVVVQLKDALNIIWDVEETPSSGIWSYVRKYVISLAAVLGLGFLLTVSLVTTTVISSASNIWGAWVPEGLMTLADFIINLGVLTLLFAMMFKWLPDTEIAWRDVWIGAALTSLLFIIGKFLIAFYVGRQGLESTFGAASSIVLVLIWIYYSAQILFFGAEFTQVYARQRGSHADIPHGHRDSAGRSRAALVPAHSGDLDPDLVRTLPYVAVIAIAGTVGVIAGSIGARIKANYDQEAEPDYGY